MDSKEPAMIHKSKRTISFHLLIFFVGLFFTVTLWDAYFNGTRPFDREIAANWVLIMGSLFSVAAGLFSWSLESRRDFLEKEVVKRTKELHDKNDELLHKNEEIENFIHIISHDLKAPIVSMRGFMTMLQDELGSALEGTKAEYFGRITANLKHMNALILDLLEFSRVGRMEDEKDKVDSKLLFQEILAELRPEISKHNIQVTVSDSLPPLLGSKKRLQQVFINLVGNAVKYMGPRPDARIEIGYSMEGDSKALIYIQDNGIGIKKEFQEKIFQIFQRAPNTLKVEGTGIGLSIVKKIVELNDGTVSVQSEEGKGSRFMVLWPVANSKIGGSGPAPKEHGVLQAAKMKVDL